jgi:hypothetical protein
MANSVTGGIRPKIVVLIFEGDYPGVRDLAILPFE